MFFHRNERKKHSLALYFTVGALAAVGAVGLTRKGKRCISQMGCKLRGLLAGCGLCKSDGGAEC